MNNAPKTRRKMSRPARRVRGLIVAFGLTASAVFGFAAPVSAGCIPMFSDSNGCGNPEPIDPSIHQWLEVSGSAGPTVTISHGSLR